MHDERVDILITCQGKSAMVKALVFHGVKHDLLLSRTVIRTVSIAVSIGMGKLPRKMTLSWPTFTAAGDYPRKPTAADVVRMDPKLLCVGGYPKAT